MNIIHKIGKVFIVLGLLLFTLGSFDGQFYINKEVLENSLSDLEKENLLSLLEKEGWFNKHYNSPYPVYSDFTHLYNSVNKEYKDKQQWDKVMWSSSAVVTYNILRHSSSSNWNSHSWIMFCLTFGLCILGGLMHVFTNNTIWGLPGIKNDGVFQNSSTNKGWKAYLVFFYLIGFYVVLYFYPNLLVNQIATLDPISISLSGNKASQWFLYGFIYCTVMSVMAIRMFIKYRHNNYQLLRTAVVLFFQIAFAFLIPELLVRFNMPYMDFKNAWPLDYDFFFDWNLSSLLSSGLIGTFMLVWGIVLTIIIVPIMTYFYGKRWYCSWVCGCGGLAETLGDPYRQHSDKSIKAWKLERWLIYSVLVFAVLMTLATLFTFFTGNTSFIGIPTYDLQKYYGFLIGSIFSGIIGTGFYPMFGNRVWCRFGCPLAAYMGLIQRFKSRFRITTNGGQCISCGNCSTYCEQGIDVRWYAQRGQNIVRSSCVGCGVCSAVCPRGVLKLENAPEEGRINDDVSITGLLNRDEFKK